MLGQRRVSIGIWGAYHGGAPVALGHESAKKGREMATKGFSDCRQSERYVEERESPGTTAFRSPTCEIKAEARMEAQPQPYDSIGQDLPGWRGY